MGINEYFVRIEFVRSGFLEFIACVPATDYYLTLVSPNIVCGKIVRTEIMEYLTNEISFKAIEYISRDRADEFLTLGHPKLGLYR